MSRNRNYAFTKKELLYTIMALLLFFQIYLQKNITPIKYIDELITVLCLAKLLIVGFKGKLNRSIAIMFVITILIATLGLVSNFTANVQTGLAPIANDIGNSFKVYIAYLGAAEYLKGVPRKRIVSALAFFIHIFLFVLFFCLILHELGLVSMGTDKRYGLNSFQFVNDGAGQLSLLFYSILLILILELQYCPEQRRNTKFFIGMALIIWASTLRSRAFMYIVIFLFIYRHIIVKNRNFKLNFQNLSVITAALLLFGASQFEAYFVNTKTARSNLLKYGIYTMQRYFPLGSGFSTFGTDAAAKYYSKLYLEYGFQYVYGLAPSNTMFARDTYWPAILAQFGVFGFLLMVVLLVLLFKDILARAKINRYAYLGALFILVTQLSASVATATFFHFVTVGLFFMIPLLYEN